MITRYGLRGPRAPHKCNMFSFPVPSRTWPASTEFHPSEGPGSLHLSLAGLREEPPLLIDRGFSLSTAEPTSRKEVSREPAGQSSTCRGQAMPTRPQGGDPGGTGLCFTLKDHSNCKQCVAIREHSQTLLPRSLNSGEGFSGLWTRDATALRERLASLLQALAGVGMPLWKPEQADGVGAGNS